MSADDPRDIMGNIMRFSLVARGTREILACTKNQVPLSILIMPFSSRGEHEVVIFAYL